MGQRMLSFVNVEQSRPEKRGAGERIEDFLEINRVYVPEAAGEQASRCSQCGVPFCQIHCPLDNNIPDWLKLAAEDRLEEAYELAEATSNMPEICGRICPHDRLCEGNCVIEKGFQSVTIGSVERFLGDTAWERGWVKPLRPRAELDQSVAIVGAGPAGLAAAEQLRRIGYRVEIYDRHDQAGGLLVYGIPNFKLEKEVVERRVNRLKKGGIKIHLKREVGRHLSLQELRADHDAVLIASGVYKGRGIHVPGVGLDNIVPAMTYLIASNRKKMGRKAPDFDSGALDAKGKKVVVIGGGDTAMDCVRTAVRQGAKSVRCLYRRDRENMPGSRREVEYAVEEGVDFVWLTTPQGFLGDGEVRGVRVTAMRLGAPDSSGRQSPEPIEGSATNIDADLVLTALGFDPDDLHAMFDTPELALTRWGTIKADLTSLSTNLDGVFAAGDVVRGASLVVWAIRDGRDAAVAIDRYLEARRGAGAADARLAKAS